MRTIIAGSRAIGREDVEAALFACPWASEISAVLSGCARGAGRAGEAWAARRLIPVELFPAEWDRFGKQAGAIRDRAMAFRAQALVAVWDGASRGTRHMIELAVSRGLRVFVHGPVGGAGVVLEVSERSAA